MNFSRRPLTHQIFILIIGAASPSLSLMHAQDDEGLSLESLEGSGSLESLKEELKKNPEAASGTQVEAKQEVNENTKDNEDYEEASDDEYSDKEEVPKTEKPKLEWAKKTEEAKDEKIDDEYGDEFESAEEGDKPKESKAPTQILPAKNKSEPKNENETPKDSTEGGTDVAVFEVGAEEQELLDFAQTVGQQISNTEWSEITKNSNTTTYTVQKNDWLFKISKKLFGTGFYYPKIWSLNSYIPNPHLIEPGMLLTFETGTGDGAPSITISHDGTKEDGEHPWNKEKEELAKQGIYINSSADDEKSSAINNEYKKYDPSPLDTSSLAPPGQYDEFGIDKNSSYVRTFKQGYFLNTFISTNQMQDFGSVESKIAEGVFFTLRETVYVKLNEGVTGNPGDQFSIYRFDGKVEVKGSDRSGDRYTILANVKLIRPMEDKWEAMITDISQSGVRGDRLTAYTPKIQKIYQTFNTKIVEALILQSFDTDMTIANIGSVVYLDRGRADGLEIGNVLDVYDTKDRSNDKPISEKFTYRTGQLNIISITDNFSTAIVSKIIHYFKIGDVAVTRTSEDEAQSKNVNKVAKKNSKQNLGTYDVDGLGPNVLSKSKSVKLTESELEELDREARKKRVLDDTEKDLKDLDAMEQELASAEQTLDENEASDEEMDLEAVESKKKGENFGTNLEDLEKNYGKKYLDEDLNQVDNPYGITQFDVEEVDELLNLTDADFNSGREVQSESKVSTGSSAPKRKNLKANLHQSKSKSKSKSKTERKTEKKSF
ncbi:MAG: LysM peptidoglycan-binding domain-containing protein [Bacteriovoracaceae bacterium]|nr:LysM peptidoglycan-binding domain-containing protein [Bacteriovoracaceae bacterium]